MGTLLSTVSVLLKLECCHCTGKYRHKPVFRSESQVRTSPLLSRRLCSAFLETLFAAAAVPTPGLPANDRRWKLQQKQKHRTTEMHFTRFAACKKCSRHEYLKLRRSVRGSDFRQLFQQWLHFLLLVTRHRLHLTVVLLHQHDTPSAQIWQPFYRWWTWVSCPPPPWFSASVCSRREPLGMNGTVFSWAGCPRSQKGTDEKSNDTNWKKSPPGLSLFTTRLLMKRMLFPYTSTPMPVTHSSQFVFLYKYAHDIVDARYRLTLNW